MDLELGDVAIFLADHEADRFSTRDFRRFAKSRLFGQTAQHQAEDDAGLFSKGRLKCVLGIFCWCGHRPGAPQAVAQVGEVAAGGGLRDFEVFDEF